MKLGGVGLAKRLAPKYLLAILIFSDATYPRQFLIGTNTIDPIKSLKNLS